jgi:hypothetical protein
MKMPSVLFMLVISLSAYSQSKPGASALSQRSQKIINSNWTFNYFSSASAEKGYESPVYDDSKWAAVSLPHTWNTFETTGELPQTGNGLNVNTYWNNGWGWYRKHFNINQSYSDRMVFLEFGGVRDYCKIWINGIYLGDHKGGYGAFDFNITRHIKKGADNVLAVAVNNSKEKGDNYIYGGILQDVSIILRNKLYIPMQGSASHEGGTFITTQGLEQKSGIVKIRTWVKNENEQPKSCTLLTTIFDADGRIVQEVRSTADIKQDQLYTFDQASKPVRNPHLWSPDDPYLYRIVSEVYDGKTLVDSYSSPLGFRWFKWDYKENSLYLNGKKTLLSTFENQVEYPWLGDALPAWIWIKDHTGLATVKKCNLIHTYNRQNCTALYDDADRRGIIIEEAIPDVSQDIRQQVLKEIIRRNRNHPSLLIRTFGNKNTFAESLVAEDTTRIILAGSSNIQAPIPHDKSSNGLTTSAPLMVNGEPARIILSSSHDRFAADRASVAIIRADIFDSGGKPVSNPTNTLKWVLTGPAKLLGPAIYNSELYLSTRSSPSNVIRSTGEAGIVKIKVFAAGMVSGSVELKSEAVPLDNSVISEPILKNDGRTGVDRIVLKPSRLEQIPPEIKPVTDAVKLSGRDRSEYNKAIRQFIAGYNPSADTTSIEFKTLTDVLAAYLFNNNGQISADDFNFNTGNFNLTRLIVGYINSTKLPQPFKEGLRTYYSDSVIKDGNEKIAGDEMNWLNWIPSGGTVVYCDEQLKTPVIKGTLVSSKNELTDLIAQVHPQFIRFSEEAKTRAIEFIAKMNPYIRQETQTEIIDGNKVITTRLLAEKGKPVLIPLYKFIAE